MTQINMLTFLTTYHAQKAFLGIQEGRPIMFDIFSLLVQWSWLAPRPKKNLMNE